MKEEEKIRCPLETDEAKYFRVIRENRLLMKDSDGFDIEDAPFFGPYPVYHFPALVKLYAMLGLHRYHMLEGTRFDLHGLMKVNQEGCAASTYYITLLATNPDTHPQKQTFQVGVDEERLGKLDLICPIARIRGTPNEPSKPYISRGGLPDWPSEIALNDRNRFYVVKRPELLETDWIYLYLQLVVCAHDRRLSLHDLSYLELVEAVIEPIEQVVPELPSKRLNAKSAIVYITYKDSRIGEPADRKAIVRRVIDEGYLSLRGELWTGEKA